MNTSQRRVTPSIAMFVQSCFLAIVSAILVVHPAPAAAVRDEVRSSYPSLLNHPDGMIQHAASRWRDLTENRQWRDSTGRFTIEADYVTHTKEKVTLEKHGGTQIVVPIEKLDESSRRMLKEIENCRPQIIAFLKQTSEYRTLMASRGGTHTDQFGRPLQRVQGDAVESPMSREEKLARSSEEEKAILADYRGMSDDHRSDLSKLEKKLEIIRKARPSPRSKAAAEELEEQRKSLRDAIAKVQARSKRTALELEQRRRRIIIDDPHPGDPEYVEMGGEIRTKEEAERARRVIAERGSPRAAADSYLRTLIAQGDVNQASYRGTTDLGRTRITTAPDSPVMTAAKVRYQVVYTSEAGLVLTRNAAVMTIQREDGLWVVPGQFSVLGRVSSNCLTWEQ